MPPPPSTPRTVLTELLASLPSNATSRSISSSTAAGLPTASNAPLPIAAKPLLLTLHVLFPTEFLPALDLLDRGLVTRFRIREDNHAAHSEGSPSTVPHGHASTRGSEGGTVLQGQQPEKEASSLQVAPGGGAATIPANAMTDADTEMLDVAARDQRSHTSLGNDGDGGREAQDVQKEDEDTWSVYHVRSAQQPRASRYSSSVDTTTSYEVRLRAWNCSCPAFAFAAFPSGAGGLRDWDGGAEFGDGEEGWRFGGLSVGAATPAVCKHLLACVLVERCELFKGYVQERDVSVEEAAGWAAGWGD